MAIQFEDKGARPKEVRGAEDRIMKQIEKSLNSAGYEKVKTASEVRLQQAEYDAKVAEIGETYALVRKEKAKLARNAKKLDRVANQVAAGVEVEAGGKTRVTMYLSDEVIAFFKALGPGYQTRIDDTLKRIVREGADRWLDER